MSAGPPSYDLIVIGAGINGAAIAREAALSGNSVLLLERDDIGCGTSAASTRLIHGGLRYLEHGELGLVRESLDERERLLRLAPHLVEPLSLYLPIYSARSRKPWQIRLGMWLYDLLSYDKSVPSHKMLSRSELLAQLPTLRQEMLVGGAQYYDAQIRYPERLVLELVQDAVSAGAELHTHAPVVGLTVDANTIRGVEWRQDGCSYVAAAQTVVNATGPWVDRLTGSTSKNALIGGTKGSHLVVKPFSGAPSGAVYAEAVSDGRPFFVVPWNGLFLIGTTDERYTGDPALVAMSAAERDYLVAETESLFSLQSPLAENFCYAQAGVRPLPASGAKSTSVITRRHLIHRHRKPKGLYSIIGGKLTTHRALAQDVMQVLRKRLKRERSSPSLNRPLPGALDAADREQLLAELSAQLGQPQSQRLWHTYGSRAATIASRIAMNNEAAMVVGPGASIFVAELVHAIEHEFASSLVDILARRVMAGLDADTGLSSAPAAADWLVRLGIWDKARADEELDSYRQFARAHQVPN
jgi:glycerol-3-phosphate dehydrogenase